VTTTGSFARLSYDEFLDSSQLRSFEASKCNHKSHVKTPLIHGDIFSVVGICEYRKRTKCRLGKSAPRNLQGCTSEMHLVQHTLPNEPARMVQTITLKMNSAHWSCGDDYRPSNKSGPLFPEAQYESNLGVALLRVFSIVR